MLYIGLILVTLVGKEAIKDPNQRTLSMVEISLVFRHSIQVGFSNLTALKEISIFLFGRFQTGDHFRIDFEVSKY